ncbi:MAG TPA: alpha/beta hydrolase [Chthonomonadaceae bacterium]|nr:alpha/beta hydrolase [Chthonomonadaceae bacterium]
MEGQGKPKVLFDKVLIGFPTCNQSGDSGVIIGMFRTFFAFFLVWLVWCAAPGALADDSFFQSNRVRIHYKVEGKGEPVVLIHGLLGSIADDWEQPGVFQALAKDYQVIALDCRGPGKSGKPHDPRQYGMQMVEDVVRLLDHLHIQKAHIVGYSLGGIITAKLLATHPDRFLTATLVASGGLHKKDAVIPLLTAFADDLEQGKGMGALMNFFTPPGQPKPTEEQIKATSQEVLANQDVQAIIAVARGIKSLVVDNATLKASPIPVLAVVGSLDPFKKSVESLAGQMPELSVVLIDGADHLTVVGRPEVLENLKRFLDRHRSVNSR